MKTHTPGPWWYDKGDGIRPNIYGPDEYADFVCSFSVCKSCVGKDSRCGVPNEKDMALMLAAPDLLEALEMAIRNSPFRGHSEETTMLRKARAAIAKAKGETK